MKILFLIPYPPGESPSQRFRFEQYLSLLKDRGHTLRLTPFLPPHRWRLFYQRGHTVARIGMIVRGFLQRLGLLLSAAQYDRIFIHREAAPIGPPIIEWFLAKVLGKKIIYDFDDAIWLTDKESEASLERILRWRTKISSICRWSHRVSCGNEYLREYAHRFNPNAVLNPTTIDTEGLHNPSRLRVPGKPPDRLVIGWTGSHSTLKYLYLLNDALVRVQQKFPATVLLVIADRPPELNLPGVMFRKWSTETEISDLMMTDIGIMPLPDDEWSKGKCGFKALQYMALGIPAVASAVGVNATIIRHMENGCLCSTDDEWVEVLEMLIANADLRQRVGSAGRQTVIEHYSVSSNSSTFLSLFE
ncbi:MAG TPA: glycosyltransferase family 4 protein [Cyclobacteriaceae bacterium]